MKTRFLALLSVLCLLLTMCPVAAQTTSEPSVSTPENLRRMFNNLGFSAEGNYFPSYNAAPDRLVFVYMQVSGLIDDYLDEEGFYNIPYTDYIAAIDSVFANHSDMIAYLTEHYDYDPANGTVSWFAGGWGDAVTWEPFAYYEDDYNIYVSGAEVWFDYAEEDFDNYTYGKDWVELDMWGDMLKGMITVPLLMTLTKTDDGLKISGFERCSYHVVDGILYEDETDATYYPLTIHNDNAYFYNTVTSQTRATDFYTVGGTWAEADKTMTFGVAPHLGYEIEAVLVNGETLTQTADGTYEIVVNGATEVTVTTTSTGEDTTTQALANEMFYDLGFCTWGENYFYYNEPAPDDVVFNYLQNSGALRDYYDSATWSYSIPYDEYIAIADQTFADHSNMIDYLGSYYDPETGIVSWFSGGYGDAVTWQPLSYYEDGDYVYVTGVMAYYDYAPEDFADYTYGKDWLYAHQTYGSYAAMIYDSIVMMAKKTENGLQIMAYQNGFYHIVDGILYDNDDQMYCAVELSTDNVYFEVPETSEATVFGFVANGGRWVPQNLPLTFYADPHYGYAITEVLFNGEAVLPNDDGSYTVMFNKASTLSINTEATHQFIDSTELIVSPVPTVGDPITLDGLSVPADAPYSIGEYSGFAWYVSDTIDGDYNLVEDGAVFEAGKYYRISGVLLCNDGYALTTDAVATVNGAPATSFYPFGNHMGLGTEFAVHEHTIFYCEATDASYAQNGCLAHYACDCGRWFEDADSEQEITDKTPFILPKLVPEVTDGKAQVNEQAVADVLERDTEEDTVVLPLEEISEEVESVELPVVSLQAVAQAEKALEVQTNSATVTLDAVALQTIADYSDDQDTVTLSVETIAEDVLNPEQQTALENKTVSAVLSAEVICGDETIHDFEGGEVTVQIPLEDDAPDTSVYEVLYIADDGTTETYDAVYENGVLTVKLTHFSEYAVVKFPLGDVNGDNTLNTADARAMLSYFVGVTPQDSLKQRAADLDGDDRITTADARSILTSTITP